MTPGLGVSAVLLLGAALATGSGPRVAAGEPLQPEALVVRGTFPMGSLGAVEIDGPLAWVSQGRWIMAVDTAAGAAPQVVGRVMVGASRHDAIDAESGRVAAVGPGGLYVLDATVPSAPAVVGHLAGAAADVRLVGDLAVLGGATVRLVSLADPALPVEVGVINVAASRLDVAGNVAYLAAGDAGLAAWDIANPAAPYEVGELDAPGAVVDVAVTGALAVVADGGRSILVVDIADAANPTLVGSFMAPPDEGCDPTGDGCRVFAGMATWGARAYIAWTNCGGGFSCRGRPMVRVLDLGDPANPAELAALDMGGSPTGVAAGAGRVLVTERPLWWYAGLAPCSLAPGGMAVFDSDLQMLGRVGVVVGTAALATDAGRVFLADPERTVTMVDVSNPAAPQMGGSVPVESIGSGYGMGGSRDVEFAAGTAYVARGPAVVVESGYAGLNGCAPPPVDEWYVAVAYAGPGRVYGLDLAGELQVLQGQNDVGRTFNSATVMDGVPGRALLSGPDGFEVVDATAAEAPRNVGHLDVVASAISQAGRWAYLAAGDRGLVVVDLVDWAHPTIASEVSTGAAAVGVHASGGIAYVAATDAVLAFDVSTPGATRLLAMVPLPGARMVTSAAPWVYAVADGGLYVLELTLDLPLPPPRLFLPAAFASGD